MKAKRKRHSAAFKAKVGLEALSGIKTVAEIAREYQVHPTQVSQWKGQVQERLPEVFENGPTAQALEAERQVERLEQKVGQLTMELDWLKKSSSNWGSEGAHGIGGVHRGMTQRACAVSVVERQPQRVLLRSQPGKPGELEADAADR